MISANGASTQNRLAIFRIDQMSEKISHCLRTVRPAAFIVALLLSFLIIVPLDAAVIANTVARFYWYP